MKINDANTLVEKISKWFVTQFDVPFFLKFFFGTIAASILIVAIIAFSGGAGSLLQHMSTGDWFIAITPVTFGFALFFNILMGIIFLAAEFIVSKFKSALLSALIITFAMFQTAGIANATEAKYKEQLKDKKEKVVQIQYYTTSQGDCRHKLLYSGKTFAVSMCYENAEAATSELNRKSEALYINKDGISEKVWISALNKTVKLK